MLAVLIVYFHIQWYKIRFVNSIYQKLKDSTLNEQTNSRVAELQIEFETEKKEKEIAQQKEEILQKSKDNYQENKETKLVYQKQYAEENKEIINKDIFANVVKEWKALDKKSEEFADIIKAAEQHHVGTISSKTIKK